MQRSPAAQSLGVTHSGVASLRIRQSRVVPMLMQLTNCASERWHSSTVPPGQSVRQTPFKQGCPAAQSASLAQKGRGATSGRQRPRSQSSPAPHSLASKHPTAHLPASQVAPVGQGRLASHCNVGLQ
jgi:hypothetical protein